MVDNKNELKKIQQKYLRRTEDGRQVRPNFFAHLAKDKGYYNPEKKNYLAHDTTMDYLQQIVRKRILMFARHNPKPTSFLRFDQIFDRTNYDVHKVVYDQVRRVLKLISDMQAEISFNYAECLKIYGGGLSPERAYALQLLTEECAAYIGKLRFGYSTMVYLLMCIEREDQRKCARTLFYMLFGYPNSSFFQAIQVSREGLIELEEVQDFEKEDLDILRLFNFGFVKKMRHCDPVAPVE